MAGGYNDELRTALTDSLGADLSSAAVQAALVIEDSAYPPANASVWRVATLADGVVSIPLDSSQALGHFHLWLKVTSDGRVWLVRVMDPEDSDQPWLVWVH